MAKKLIIIGVIVVVIGGLIGALYFLNQLEGDDSDYPSYEPPQYVYGEAPAPTLASLEVRNELDGYTLVNEKPDESKSIENYSFKGLEHYNYQSYPVSNLIDRATTMVVTEVIAEDGANLADFGLDRPRAAADMVYTDGTKVSILIGAEAGTEGVYVMRKDSPTVYLVLPTYVAPFLSTSLDFLDTAVTLGLSETDQNTGEGATAFTTITLGGTVRSEPIVIRATPESQVEAGGGILLNTHEISSPTKVRLHMEKGLAVVQKVFGLQATLVEAAVSTPADLAAYGLDEPYSTAEVQTEELGNFKLLVSKPNDDRTVFVKRADSGLIYRVPVDSVPWLESQVFDLMDKMVILPYIDKVSTVTVFDGSTTTVFELSGADDDFVAKTGGKALDTKNFKTYYQTMLSASYESYEKDMPDHITISPTLQFTYAYRDGTKADVVSFYTSPYARRVYIALNDDAPFLASSTYVDRVKNDLKLLLAGEKLSSYL